MFPTLPVFDYPLYTWVGLGLLALFGLGCLLAVARLVYATVLVWLSGAWLGLCALAAWLLGQPDTGYGSARWSTRRDLLAAKLLTPDTTRLPLASWGNGETLREPSGGHAMVCGPPRSKKSWGVIMPVLRHWQGSCIVTDLRGELREHTGARRAELGTVWNFAPAEPTSVRLNLLDTVRWSTRHEHADVTRIAAHLLQPTGSAQGDDFRRHALGLLRAVIVHCRAIGQGHFPGVLQFCVEPGSMADKLATLAASPHPTVQAGAQRALDMPLRLRGNVWSAIVEVLDVFSDPQVAAHTRTSDVRLEELLTAPEPTTLYLSLAFHDISRLSRVMGLFVEQLVALLSTPGSAPRHRLLLCLDEMANLGRLSELERSVSYLQGSGAQCLMAWQNIAQVVDLYGPTSPLLASVATSLWYTPTPSDDVTAKHVSTILGVTTSTHTTSSTSTSPWGLLTSESTSTSGHARPLMTPDEVRRLAPDQAILTTTGHPPALARKLGQPRPGWATRLVPCVRQHPGVAASLAAAGLLVALLHPLWQSSVTPTSVVAQAALGPEAGQTPRDWRGSPAPDAGDPLVPPTPLPERATALVEALTRACVMAHDPLTGMKCGEWLNMPAAVLEQVRANPAAFWGELPPETPRQTPPAPKQAVEGPGLGRPKSQPGAPQMRDPLEGWPRRK